MQKKTSLIRLFFVGTAVPLLALLYFFKDARTAGFFPKCPFHALTGLYCPGCGSQRAVSSLLHGEIVQALQFNVLLVTSLPLLMYSACVSVLNVFRKEQIIPVILYSPLFVKTFLLVVIVFFVVRNIPLSPFTFLAPHTGQP